MKIGVNTYGMKGLLRNDFEGTMKSLKEMGYDAIEPCIVFDACRDMDGRMMQMGLERAGFAGGMWVASQMDQQMTWVKNLGFSVPGAHVSLVQTEPKGLVAMVPQMIEVAKKYGLSYYVYSPQKDTIAKIQEVIPQMKEAYRLLKAEGIELLFHNHHDELKVDQGDTPMEYLLRQIPEMKIQLDVGWVKFAGRDVCEMMHIYADRIAIVHFKDITADAGPQNQATCFTAIGEGSIPLQEILKISQTLPLMDVGYIIDQDASNGDMLTDLLNGYGNLCK